MDKFENDTRAFFADFALDRLIVLRLTLVTSHEKNSENRAVCELLSNRVGFGRWFISRQMFFKNRYFIGREMNLSEMLDYSFKLTLGIVRSVGEPFPKTPL